MNNTQNQTLLTSDSIAMLIASMTQKGNTPLTELEAERFLNAVARIQSGVPTAVRVTEQQ